MATKILLGDWRLFGDFWCLRILLNKSDFFCHFSRRKQFCSRIYENKMLKKISMLFSLIFEFPEKEFSSKKLENNRFFSRISTFFLSLMTKMFQISSKSGKIDIKCPHMLLFGLGNLKWRFFCKLKKLGDKSGDFGAKAWRHEQSAIWQHYFERICQLFFDPTGDSAAERL
jgi:hypothetical protein